MRFARADEQAPFLEPGHHAYLIFDTANRLRGMVASGSTSRGRGWWAYRPMPSRVEPWLVATFSTSRIEAARALVQGRP